MVWIEVGNVLCGFVCFRWATRRDERVMAIGKVTLKVGLFLDGDAVSDSVGY